MADSIEIVRSGFERASHAALRRRVERLCVLSELCVDRSLPVTESPYTGPRLVRLGQTALKHHGLGQQIGRSGPACQ